MLLSAIMRVLNEEEMLPGCLDSLLPVCDEIIMVDTGSTDRTVEIASRYPQVNVLHYPAPAEISERQVHYVHAYDAYLMAFLRARGRWVLMIDADEGLCPRAQHRLRKELKRYREVDFVSIMGVHFVTPSEYQPAWTSIAPGRLARRRPELSLLDDPNEACLFQVPTGSRVKYIPGIVLFHNYWHNRAAKNRRYDQRSIPHPSDSVALKGRKPFDFLNCAPWCVCPLWGEVEPPRYADTMGGHTT